MTTVSNGWESPPWYVKARAEIGVKEVPGPGDSKSIIDYAKDAGVYGAVNNDDVPWCAAFVGAMLKRCDIQGSGKANAKSYLDWGVSLRGPVLGCIVVLNRPPVSWQGHVGFYVGRPAAGKIRILGGNQANMVCEADFDAKRLNQYRWPTALPIQPRWVGPIDVTGAALSNPTDR